jgi:hypothetical protein
MRAGQTYRELRNIHERGITRSDIFALPGDAVNIFDIYQWIYGYVGGCF